MARLVVECQNLDQTDYSQTSLALKSSTILCQILYGKLTNSPTFSMYKVYANECAEASWTCADIT